MRAAAVRWWRLVAAGEPFRLLFPVGTAIGLFGVLLWPAFVGKLWPAHPGVMHARIMIEGFMTCFVIGFLGTALPRLLDVPRLGGGEALGYAAALAGVAWLHACGNAFWGDQLFFLALGSFLMGLGIRALFRKDTPPPGFVLVGMGMLSALFGVATQVAAHVSPEALPAGVAVFGRLLLLQGYLLLPVMGVGAFLLPRFFGLPNRHSFPESLELPAGWAGRAAFALGCGLAVAAGFALEAAGMARWGLALRAAAVVAYFVREVPVHRAGWGGGSLAFGLRLALFSIPAGYALMAAWPDRAVPLLHVVFLTGFSLLAFVVASRVVLGHSGQSGKFRARLGSVTALVVLVVLAMLARVSADWLPRVQLAHYAYAAVLWSLGVVLWAAGILPGVMRPDEEEAG